ncbi:g11531 [Coccomyxa viridis]|uniref:G11531 protein n=1 Tax=Coccomyxa viridis TaxID=1274662 RepID=A0ABP1G856_9CHLO
MRANIRAGKNIFGRMTSKALLGVAPPGDAAAALVTEMHRHAVRAEKIVKSDTLSDDELFSAITPLFTSLVAAVETANNANGSTYLWDDIRMAE